MIIKELYEGIYGPYTERIKPSQKKENTVVGLILEQRERAERKKQPKNSQGLVEGNVPSK